MAEGTITHVPSPPTHLRKPNAIELAEGIDIHRIHKKAYRGNEFNPGKGGETRFAPIYDTVGNCIPTLYAANSIEAAIYETIFHDVPLDSDVKSVPFRTVEMYQRSVLQLRRKLNVASLRALDLLKWSISQAALSGCNAAHYQSTVRWASSVHDQFDDIEGLLWTSNLCDPNSALVFFGDRVKSSDFKIVSSSDASDDSFVADVGSAPQRGSIVLTM